MLANYLAQDRYHHPMYRGPETREPGEIRNLRRCLPIFSDIGILYDLNCRKLLPYQFDTIIYFLPERIIPIFKNKINFFHSYNAVTTVILNSDDSQRSFSWSTGRKVASIKEECLICTLRQPTFILLIVSHL